MFIFSTTRLILIQHFSFKKHIPSPFYTKVGQTAQDWDSTIGPLSPGSMMWASWPQVYCQWTIWSTTSLQKPLSFTPTECVTPLCFLRSVKNGDQVSNGSLLCSFFSFFKTTLEYYFSDCGHKNLYFPPLSFQILCLTFMCLPSCCTLTWLGPKSELATTGNEDLII